ANIVTYRLPSYGTFSTNLQTRYWFGIPRNVSFGGLTMDIDRAASQRVSKSNNPDEALAFSHSRGARMSAMEHLVPEMMFSTDTEQAQGISAVKALAIASAEGQKIWTIDQNNWHLAQSALNLPTDTMQDIENAVYAGQVVTAHEEQILFHGWEGEGYIILDPRTGGGGYMIAGGGNGRDMPAGALQECASYFMGSMSLGMDLLSLLADTGKEVATFFGKIFKGLGGILDVADV